MDRTVIARGALTKETTLHRGAVMSLRHVAVNMYRWNVTHAQDVFRVNDDGSQPTIGEILKRAMRYYPSKRRKTIQVIEHAAGATFTETR